jgi:hypothetical protein
MRRIKARIRRDCSGAAVKKGLYNARRAARRSVPQTTLQRASDRSPQCIVSSGRTCASSYRHYRGGTSMTRGTDDSRESCRPSEGAAIRCRDADGWHWSGRLRAASISHIGAVRAERVFPCRAQRALTWALQYFSNHAAGRARARSLGKTAGAQARRAEHLRVGASPAESFAVARAAR